MDIRNQIIALWKRNKARSNAMNDTLDNRGAMLVNEFCAWAGISRSLFYREVSAGRIRLRKIGSKRSVVTIPDALQWRDGLPVAEIN